MQSLGFEALIAELQDCEPVKAVGRVSSVAGDGVRIEGLSEIAALGDLIALPDAMAEVVHLTDRDVLVTPDGSSQGLQIGDMATLVGKDGLAPDQSWLGRVVDPYGKALDGGPILRGPRRYPLRGAPINPTDRRGLGARMETGMKVFNTLLPLVKGQRIGLFAGSGIGKSTLLARFAHGVEADVVVVALIGERGREVRDFVERILGSEGMQRAVVVAATSDTSAMVRRRAAWAAMAVAEYFRDEGQQVLLLADSVTRFADAHREIATAAGEPPALRGYPPSTTQLITQLCERAGPGAGYVGDITAVFSVLVAGSDMEEPISDVLRGVLDGHIVLDRKIAERGRFPAIDVLRSVSRSLPEAADASENDLITRARRILGAYDRSEMMIQAGLYSAGSDPEIDAAIKAFPKLDTFIAMREEADLAASFKALAKCLT